MKKTLSLILALLMSLSTASVAFADEAAVIAEDVEATAVIEDVVEEETVAGPYDEALTYLKAYHIINGLGDGELGAEKAVKRYEMALFVSRISTGWVEDSAWATTNYTPYTDLEGSGASNVIGALTYADENGIIKGVGDNRFAPEAQVTYQDALTMAVRTLGYTNLSYPWGNITKAIELGLTEGIEDVAYTTPIARGVAAQIIYNALMAPTKNGGTLAAKNFNEFGWETVVITATSKDVLVDAKKAAAGFLGFQIVEDGELAETVYYADAAYFGLDATAYEDVLAIGASYDVLFEMNEDGLTNIVDIIDVKSNYVETLWNAEGETEIA
ncbi:MAG: S-layer homology domain-containing protein, partial [Clostridia bacterium]|nr:S-layer homology domain-containing protein [Clostridia bacterium]